MKRVCLYIALFLIALLIGWLVPARSVGMTNESASPSHQKPPNRAHSASSSSPSSTIPTSPHDLVDLTDLEGIENLRQSPLLSAAHWMGGDNEPTDPGFSRLAEWLDLSSSEQARLARVLRQETHRRRDWEQANLRSSRNEEGKATLTWIDHDPESLPLLQKALDEAFGETLGRSLFIRGGLHRFFEPLPGWNAQRSSEITVSIKPMSSGEASHKLFSKRGDATAAFSCGDLTQSFVFPSDANPLVVYPRLDHLFDYSVEVAALKQQPAPPPQYPTARSTEKEGHVISPYTGTMIDVTGMPPGTLVADPTKPASEKAYFRVPPSDSE